jgi:MFS family permease
MFLGFLSVSLPLPVLALYVHETLGFPTAIAGFVVGLQSLATILTRAPSGRMVDRLGPKTALGRGLLVAAVSGFGTLASAALAATPLMALAVLLVARLALGIGESLLITGVLSWALVRAGPGRSGRAMGWNGIA